MSEELYRIDGVLWQGTTLPKPVCPIHRLEMDPITFDNGIIEEYNSYVHLRCDECEDDYEIPREFSKQVLYVARKLRVSNLKAYKIIDFDGEATPLAEDSDSDDTHFVIAKLMNTKVGKRMVVYAGKKGEKNKVQIFIEPDIKRLAFDQKDVHPSEVFVKLEAQFKDGQKQTIEKPD